uniref:Large ribosomal subunit protein bL9m n=1 Tax=Lygus hesperus TaxID=30085 RepID=A0A146LK09_LYGHE
MYELSRHLRHFNRYVSLTGNQQPLLATFNGCNLLAKRTTFILKRKYPVKLLKYGETEFRLKGKDYVYDLVQDTEVVKKPSVKIVLKQYIEGVGLKGDVVNLPRNKAYNEFLLTGLADYATPEVLEASKKLKKEENKQATASSPFAQLTTKYLENFVLSIVMNKENPWTIQPWHIRVAFRKAGIQVPEHAIKIPDKPISGPDLSLENRDFVTTITVNGREKANVRCRIHHWSTNPSNRMPYVRYPGSIKTEPIFEADAPILDNIPLIPLPKEKSDF